MIYYVSINGDDKASGEINSPFRTIGRASEVARAGDVVRVFGGTYREWVNPKRGGDSPQRPITYEAMEGEKVIIKGSEQITDWERVDGSIWRKALPNSFFADYNPFAEELWGDWFRRPNEDGYKVHAGELYINGVAAFEATSMEDMRKAEIRYEGIGSVQAFLPRNLMYPERTVYRWMAELQDDKTLIYCNFADKDPNKETIEINVRKYCFFPEKTGINYITVRGFEICQAACGWAPPTGEQPGAIGPHWSKGWVIEGNVIHDAKCCGISIGKEISTGNNESYLFGRKSGHRYQVETTFAALNNAGWSRDNIGSHVIKNNRIYACGQCGIVGNLGCVFSTIEDNHIYEIGVKREFWGHEIAAIKLHGAIDVTLKGNHIHHCQHGTWLDWQAQGTRVTKNFYHDNTRCDLMVEVTHGPCTVDNNIFLSDTALVNQAQGTALVNNLIRGIMFASNMLTRATPYHCPHSTLVMGYAAVYGGDDRLYNNIFAGEVQPIKDTPTYSFCGAYYDRYSTECEYIEMLKPGMKYNSLQTYTEIPQPVYIGYNAYSGNAAPFRKEESPVIAVGISTEISENGGEWTLSINVPKELANMQCPQITAEKLGTPRVTCQSYENADGSPLNLKTDYFGIMRENTVIPGPFAKLSIGENKITVWSEK